MNALLIDAEAAAPEISDTPANFASRSLCVAAVDCSRGRAQSAYQLSSATALQPAYQLSSATALQPAY